MNALRLRRAFCAPLLALLLAGCSATQMVYDNAETLIRWRATTYLDVHGDELIELERSIEGFARWHRAEALPHYARIADEAAGRLARGLTRADLEWGYRSGRAQLEESLRAAATRIAPLADRLSAEQLQHFETRLAEDNRKFAEEHLAGDEATQRADRTKRNLKRLEEWFGTLDGPQRALVERYSARAPLTAALRDVDRRKRQQGLLEMLRAREARRRLADFVAHWDQGRAPEYAEAGRRQLEAFYELMLGLDRTLSTAQRARAVGRLRGMAADFRSLHAARTSP